MKAAQEYGSELNAVTMAMRHARETGMPWYAVECAYGWIDAERKPSLRFGKVWECYRAEYLPSNGERAWIAEPIKIYKGEM